MYKIASAKNLTGDLYEFKIEAPHITRHGKPGQFIILRVDAKGERIPLTIADIDKKNGLLTIVFMAVGFTTKKLAALKTGESIQDIVGPLGVATETTENFGTVAVVAGGYGAAPAYLIAQSYKENGNKVYMIFGARNEELLFWQDKMKNACDELYITTDDGSFGIKGLVTDPLKMIIEREKVDHVMCIGPIPMMRAVARLTKEYDIYTIASMNPLMVDGTGMCGGCRVSVDGEIKFACVDGPDFDAHKVDFDELINRNKVYDHYTCKLESKVNELEAQKF
ncbi:MAG: sulfide/dihydroorotate dehydrogenase-like FAD/NAD-binding protein [Cyanobacteriota bacterium]